MPAPQTLPPQLLHRPFTVREALAVGVSRDVLRGARFTAPFPGVRVPVALGDGLGVRCRALALLLPAAAFSHVTAAELHALPAPRTTRQGLLHVSVPTGCRLPRMAGVRGHHGLVPSDVCSGRGHPPVVRAPLVWAQLAAQLPPDELVVLGDAVLARGLGSLQELDRLSRNGRRGGPAMRRALPMLEPASGSPMESRLRLLLVRAGLPRPLANRDVVHDGEWLARPDLSYPQWLIAIEYEGDHHRTDRRQWKRDKSRRRLLEDAGWVVIEVVDDDVFRTPEATVARVRTAIARQEQGGARR